MIRLILALLLAPFRAGFCWLGGDSDSSTTTNQYDKRVTGRDGAQVSGDNNTVNVTATDYGAVMAGQETARAALTAGTLATIAASDVFNRASQQNANLAETAIGKTIAAVSDAYATAKAGDQQIVSMVGMAVVGLAAVFIFAGKR